MAAIATGETKYHDNRDPMAPLLRKFDALVEQSIDAQAQLFLTSFIFTLGDRWRDVIDLATVFKVYVEAHGNTDNGDIDAIQAADFLQKNGRTRTGLQRKAELRDIDMNNDNRICLIEYLLLHYKPMILGAFYERKNTPDSERVDLSQGGIGITGVGFGLLDELFTLPVGLPAELQQAIDDFFAMKQARERKIKALQAKASKGGVRGMAAQNELAQIAAGDMTSINRLEITLNAAKRRAAKSSGVEALAKKRAADAKAKKTAQVASRNRLAARAAMFGGTKKATPSATSSSRRGSNIRRVPTIVRRSLQQQQQAGAEDASGGSKASGAAKVGAVAARAAMFGGSVRGANTRRVPAIVRRSQQQEVD